MVFIIFKLPYFVQVLQTIYNQKLYLFAFNAECLCVGCFVLFVRILKINEQYFLSVCLI